MGFNDYETSDHEGSKVELYLFETEDGLFRRAYTTDRQPLTVLGHTFVPEAIKRGELTQNAGTTGSERLTITLPFDNDVAVIHVPYLPPRPIRVTIYSYQRLDVTTEIIQGFTGYITSFAQRNEEADLLCSQIIDTFQQTVPWAVFKVGGCIWSTYEDGCGVDKVPFLTEATVASLAATTIVSPDFATKPDGWFTAGYITNEATGEVRFITYHVGDQIKVVHPFTALAPGVVLNAYAGDDHTEQTCREKFNNKINYLGFDHFPSYNVFSRGSL
jgi:uncharacterized phage protein (TIGR02218 family)